MISLTPICPVCGSAPNADGSHVCRDEEVAPSAGILAVTRRYLKTVNQMAASLNTALRRDTEAKAVMISAHDHLVEWYVQDQGDFLGIPGAINAAHREVEAVKLIDAWLGKCPRMYTDVHGGREVTDVVVTLPMAGL